MISGDPYQYFRIEARELLEHMTEGCLGLEKGNDPSNFLSQLLRWAHTLKGAARVVKQVRISELAHEFETVLEPFRSQDPRAIANLHGIVNSLLKLIDAMQDQLKQLNQTSLPSEPNRSRTVAPTAPDREDSLDTIRMSMAEMDVLFDAISEASILVESLKKKARSLRNPELENLIEKLERQNIQIKNDFGAHRLLPAHIVFPTLQRTCRDTAEQLKKQVELITSGGDIHLDADVLSAVRGALIQLVRNAIAHGIETEERRIQGDKPSVGTISIKVERRENRVAFICGDDGQGIDVHAIQQAATKAGIISSAEKSNALTVEQVFELLQKGGISTASTTTEHAGRGVGINLVWETIKRVKGEISFHSELGKGVQFTLSVPSSLESLRVMHVKAGTMDFALPFDSIKQVVWLNPQHMVHSGKEDMILHNGHTLPFAPLDRFAKNRIAIIVEIHSKEIAIGVESIDELSHVVVKPIPKLAGSYPWIAGAFLNATGNPQLVLEPTHLAPLLLSSATDTLHSLDKEHQILVIDDSLTSRMLEQSILESAGYKVKAISSATEALKQGLDEHISLIIVDVEMPGMNGFEFIEHLRNNPKFSHIPAVLVTSRGSEEDLQRGKKAGAQAHILKSEFNESGFLKKIQELIG